ncbi:MAG: PEP-CTERM sorting domain-containing protein [Thiobacillus sp.]|nr:PEP-CTERM sorting domain-containing protein [Thiobacillus sp.]
MASNKNGSAGYSLNIGYSTGSYCNWYANCGAADQSQTLFSQTSRLSGKGKSTLSQDIEGEFTFAYDKAFQLTATLNVNAANGGMADFTLASLDDSLVLPAGANLLSASGQYVQAVPEAETYAMMLAGLGLVGGAVARRRAMSK